MTHIGIGALFGQGRGWRVARGAVSALVPALVAAFAVACGDDGGSGDDGDDCIELQGVIPEDTTLDRSCYLVVDDLYVDDGVTLTDVYTSEQTWCFDPRSWSHKRPRY